VRFTKILLWMGGNAGIAPHHCAARRRSMLDFRGLRRGERQRAGVAGRDARV
jgi:hypothetical protein